MSSQTLTVAPLSIWETLLLGVPRARAHRLLPGIGLALLGMILAERLSAVIGWISLRLQGIEPTGRSSAISPITCAILIGLVTANSVGVHAIFRPGLDFCVKKLLRLGIILVGLRLSLLDVLRLGVWGVPVVICLIGSALVLTGWIARRLGISDRLGALAAASTAICGVTAAVAIAPIIEADEQEVAYTVANVTIFGMLAMLLYPYGAHLIFGAQSGSAGLFLGTAIHDTSQVMGAAIAYKDVFGDELAMKVATITKLTRNVFLAGVVPLLAFYFARKRGQGTKRVKIAKLFPMFVAGFLAMAVVRSIGEAGVAGSTKLAYGLWTPATWTHIVKMLGETMASSALGAAMAAVGLTTSLKALRVLGLKPLYVGAASATIVGAVGLCLAAVVGPKIDLGIRAAGAAPPGQPAIPAPRHPQVDEPPIAQAEKVIITRPLDTDGDGIIDTYDACTGASGPESTDAAKNGCPLARIEHGQILTLEAIRFHGKTDKLTAASRPVLFAIARLLEDHEEIRRVSIKSFTDNRGLRRERFDLTRRRALAVRHWLTTHHIPRARVRVEGLGGKQPIDTNDTKEGRRRNQRIEIDVVESDDTVR